MGKAGSSESAPVFCEWRWYYHLPSMALWGPIVLALVVPKENRCRRAWLILIPLFLVMAIWQMPARLFSLPLSAANPLGFFVNSLAVAWTVVWLLGRRLGSQRPFDAFFWMLGAMMLVGFWAYTAEYGTRLAPQMIVVLIPYAFCSVTLLLSMELARILCRKTDRPGPFMAWLFFCMGFLSGTAMLLLAILLAMVQLAMTTHFDTSMLMFLVLQTAVVALFLAIVLYLGNLPFLLLAFKSSFYRERFRSTFGLEPKGGRSPFAESYSV